MSNDIYKIYKITNNINDKVYIGQTKQKLSRRFAQHCISKHLIGKALRKHGSENFTIETLLVSDSLDYVNLMEVEVIKAYETLAPKGYNLASGGKNFNHSEETKLKFRARKQSKETVEKRVESRKWYKHSEETKAKMREAAKGRGHSEDAKAKMKESHVGVPLSEAHKKSISDANKGKVMWSKAVFCSTLGVAFDSAKEASVALKVNHSSIIRICKGKQKSTSCGLVFEYI